MAGKTITRADLAEAVYQKAGLTRSESANLVEQVLGEVCDTLIRGEEVKLSGFGTFIGATRPSASVAILRQGSRRPSRSAGSWCSGPPTTSRLT